MNEKEPSLLPTSTAVALCRAHRQYQREHRSDEQLRVAIQTELEAHKDLLQVIEAQSLLSVAILNVLENFIPKVVPVEAFLIAIESAICMKAPEPVRGDEST